MVVSVCLCSKGARRGERRPSAYLSNHHVAIECALAARVLWSGDVRADFGDDGSAEGHVWHEMPVHDVQMDPIASIIDYAGAHRPKISKICIQNGRRYDRRGCHGEVSRSLAKETVAKLVVSEVCGMGLIR